MSLLHIEINNLRNLLSLQVTPGSGFNLLYGANGSGKTSFLEAIYFLSLGRSFRSHHSHRLINHEAQGFSLFAQTQQEILAPIGIERQQNGSGRTQIHGKEVTSLTDLTRLFPVQLINSDEHRLLGGGPKYRRHFLDWGTFHVEHIFFPVWQRTFRALKQRNAALKTRAQEEQIRLWDSEFVAAGLLLHQLRETYIHSFAPIFLPLWKRLLPEYDLELTYYRGWGKERELEEVLRFSLERDRQLGFTQFGPHRADFAIKAHGIAAQDILSQGQQKLLVYALRLAQGALLQTKMGKQCIYLMDDLPAELDKSKRKKVISVLSELKAQVFITGNEYADLSDICPKDAQRFHVEHGQIILK